MDCSSIHEERLAGSLPVDRTECCLFAAVNQIGSKQVLAQNKQMSSNKAQNSFSNI